MIVNGFLFVGGTHSQKWIKLDQVQFFETRGTEGKPLGWVDYCAATVQVRDGQCATLTTAEWEEAKNSLGFPETGAMGCPPPYVPKENR